jgi:hypothetical protein
MDLLYKEEAYRIIGACMEVHRELWSKKSRIQKDYQNPGIISEN